jgi:hypothetical protein
VKENVLGYVDIGGSVRHKEEDNLYYYVRNFSQVADGSLPSNLPDVLHGHANAWPLPWLCVLKTYLLRG